MSPASRWTWEPQRSSSMGLQHHILVLYSLSCPNKLPSDSSAGWKALSWPLPCSSPPLGAELGHLFPFLDVPPTHFSVPSLWWLWPVELGPRSSRDEAFLWLFPISTELGVLPKEQELHHLRDSAGHTAERRTVPLPWTHLGSHQFN